MTSRAALYQAGLPFGESCTRTEGNRRIYGGGGGGSSSSSSNATTTQNTDKRQVVDGGSVGVSSDSSTVNVNTTDHGAVNAAMTMAGNTEAGALDAYKALLAATVQLAGASTKTIQANSDLAGQLAGTVTDTVTSADDAAQKKQYMIYAALAGAVYFVSKKA